MSLKASEQVEKNRWELEVQVGAEEFADGLTKAFQKKQKSITLPGWRKGKAPRGLIEKYYGKEIFYEDAVNALYPAALDAAVEEAGLTLVDDKIDLDITEINENGFTFKAKVTTKPEVKIEDYKGLEAKKLKVEVTEADVDAEVARVRERNSRLVNVERAAKNGDTAEIDYEGFVDGVAFAGGKDENHNLELGSGQFIPGFEEQIVGHSAEEEFDVNVTFPEDYHAEDLKGKTAVFKVKLHAVKEKELPELDDEFAKDVSEFDTLVAYREDVMKKLTENKEKQSESEFEHQVIDQLVEKMEAEIPEAMIENRIHENLRDFEYRLSMQGMDLKTYAKYTGMDEKAMADSMRPQAETQVKLRLALEKIAVLEGLEATAEELDAEYEKIAKQYEMEADKIKGIISAAELSKDLAVEKAIKLVKDNAKVTEVTSLTEEKPKKASKPKAAKTEDAPAEEAAEKPKKAAPKAKKTEEAGEADEKPAPKKTAKAKKEEPKAE